MKKIIVFSVILMAFICALIVGCVSDSVGENTSVQVIPTERTPLQITYYYSPTCSFCTDMGKGFDKLEASHSGEFILTKHKVQDDEAGFFKVIASYDISPQVPFTIIGNRTFVGYNEDIYNDIESMIENR